MTPDLSAINARIRERLAALRLSQREASKAAGLNLGYIGDLASGKSKTPSGYNLDRLAEVLQCSAAWLSTGQDTPPSAPGTAWVVTGSRGEYSDRAEWPARVLWSETDAQAFVERVTRDSRRAAALAKQARDAWLEGDSDYTAYERKLDELKAGMLDPALDLTAYGADSVSYELARTPVGAPEAAR